MLNLLLAPCASLPHSVLSARAQSAFKKLSQAVLRLVSENPVGMLRKSNCDRDQVCRPQLSLAAHDIFVWNPGRVRQGCDPRASCCVENSLPTARTLCSTLTHTILYYAILYYTILYYTVLYYTILYDLKVFLRPWSQLCQAQAAGHKRPAAF